LQFAAAQVAKTTKYGLQLFLVVLLG